MACLMHSFAGVGHTAELQPSDCRLIKERLEKYDALLNDLVFLDVEYLQGNPQIFDWYQHSVQLEVLSGELDRLREAANVLDRLCP
ncbi:hypothetical protein HNR26_003798 [Rhizobium rosettiformans]|uniref:Uncharacterized protein n=1 Tax=Rhizobium rosettiformans TaxID=1368430 RepID=A0A7W8HTA7_9HYPH|nr:hypothetical protein [Rhizobium rosettiformans]